MKMTFLGVGSAFSLQNYQSNIIIESGKDNILIDAGGDIRHALKAQNKSYKDIHTTYISHLHADHIGGMEYLAFCTYFDPSYKAKYGGKMQLIGNHRVIDQLWHSMEAGVRSIQGKVMSLDDYFDVIRIADNGNFRFNSTLFQLVQTIHVMDAYSFVPSYGLLWVGPNGQRIFLTTDTQFAPRQIETFYDQSDIILHDCETSKFKSGVHAHYEDLKTLPDKTKNKTHLYHYNDGDLPNAEQDGFAGFISQGQIFDFSVKSH